MALIYNPRLHLYSGAVMISFSPVYVRLADVAPTVSAFYRVLIGGLALSLFLLVTGRRLSFSRTAWIAIGAAAVFFALDLWFWHRSILYIGPGLSTLLANMQVFFMIAAGYLLFAERPTMRQFVAAAIAIFGLSMIIAPEWSTPAAGYRIGIVFGVLTAVSYAGYLLSLRRARESSIHPIPVRELAVVSLLVAAILGAAAGVENVSLAIPSAADAGWLLAYGLLAHALGWMLIAGNLTRVAATEVGIALLLQPSLSYVWDVLFFARPMTTLAVSGVIITLGAIFSAGNGATRSRRSSS